MVKLTLLITKNLKNMKLGNIVEKLIHYLTFGQGKKIATWFAKKMGYESCNCESRKKALNNIKIKRW